MKAQKFITEANKQQVCRLLGWSMEQYTEYQQSKGLEYLADQVCGDSWSVEQVAKTALFWRWWVNHWNARDAEFIADARNWPTSWLPRKYEDLNAVEGFAFRPHKTVLEESYANLIYSVNKEAVA